MTGEVAVRRDFGLVDVPFVEVVEVVEESKVVSSEKCLVCLEEANGADGRVINCCPSCKNCWCHAHCFNKFTFAQPGSIQVDGVDEKEHEMVLRARKNCMACKSDGVVPMTFQPLEKPSIDYLAHCRNVYERKDDEMLNFSRLNELSCGEGESIRVHPWTVFQMKWPRRLEKNQDGVYWYRVATSLKGDTLSARFKVLYEDDVVVGTFGPFCKVRSGRELCQWPINWSNATWVRYAGKIAVRHLHGTVNFNWDQVRQRMMEIITKDIPAWECLEHDCHTWCQSDEARDYCIQEARAVVKDKERIEGLMFLKRAMSTTLSSQMILFIHSLIPYMPHLKNIQILLMFFFPALVTYLVQHYTLFQITFIMSLPAFLFYQLDCITGLISGSMYEIPKLKVANVLKIWKSCSLGVVVPPLSENATLNLKRKVPIETKCEQCRALEVYGTIIHGIPAVIPMACCHDIYNGLRIRFLFHRDFDPAVLKEYYAFSIAYLRKIVWSYWLSYSFLDWFLHLSGKRRQTLEQEDDYKPLTYGSWFADIFVKGEAYVGKTWKSFKPRIIQCRKSSLQLLIGPFFYSMLKWFSRTFSSGSIIYAPTKNALELGEFVAVQEGIPVEADASNWDGSVCKTDLEIEKFCLENIVPYRPWWLSMLLGFWLATIGSSQGVSYSCDWGRRSGDMWTSLFNSLLNILKTLFVWKEKLKSLVVNGDDSMFWLNSLDDLEAHLEKYKGMGMKMELIVRSSWRDLEFCSGRFYTTYRGVKWGLKPFRQLAKFGFNFNRHSRRKFKSLLLGNALSMLPIAGHIPVFGIFLRRIVATAGKIQPLGSGREEWQITDTVVDEIHPAEEERFKQLYGLTDVEYGRLVSWANSVHIDNFPMVLEDPLFTKCASIDLGCSPTNDLSHYQHELWYEIEERENPVEEIVPFVEEFIAWWWQGSWVVNGLIEFLCGSFWAPLTHYVLSLVRAKFGFVFALCVHLFINKFLAKANLLFHLRRRQWNRGPDCDCIYWVDRLGVYIVGSRESGLFSLIRDCVGSVNNRLTRWSSPSSVFGRGTFRFKMRVRRNRTNVKKVVVVQHKQQRTSGRKRPRKSGGASKAVSLYALSRVNPFLGVVNGIKSPDEFGYPTGTAVLRAAYTVSSDANGRNARLFNPMTYDAMYAPAGLDIAGVVTWAGGTVNALPQVAQLNVMANLFRVVGWGIRITTDLSLTSASGHIWVCHAPLDMSVNIPYGGSPSRESEFASLPLAEKYSLVELAERPLIVPGKAFDSGVHRFRTTSLYEDDETKVGVESSFGWCQIGLYITGAPAGLACLNVEVIYHVEYMQKANSLYGFIDTLPGPNSPAEIMQAQAIETAMPVGVIETAVDMVDKAANVAVGVLRIGSALTAGVGKVMSAAGRLGTMKNGMNHSSGASPFARLGWR